MFGEHEWKVFTSTIYGCYHFISGEILSHFYVRQSSESPKLTILEALWVNRFLSLIVIGFATVFKLYKYLLK